MGRRSEQQGQAEADQDDRIGALEQQQQYAPPAPAPQAPAAAAPSPLIDQLNQLAALHQQGALTDTEFAAAKAKLLGT
jgi:hypothetical protein